MNIVKRLFAVNVDLPTLGKDLSKNKIKNQEWFSVIETFIKSFDQERELIQLLGITKLHTEDTDNNQSFSKAIFKVMDDERLNVVTCRKSICREEYYDKLINSNTDSVESKIRLTFYHGDTKFSLECLKDSTFTVMEIEYFSDIPEKSTERTVKEIFGDFNSIEVVKELDTSMEETFYRLRLHPLA